MSNITIDPAQCRAARALLNWSQPELAERSGLTVNPIVSFEKEGSSRPAARTMRRMVQAFELAGVMFTANGGVEWRTDLLTILEGEDAIVEMMEDIYQNLKNKGGEVLIAGLSEPDPANTELCDSIRAHIARLQAANISEKILVEQGETNFIAPTEWYRSLDEDEFNMTPYHQYGDNIAVIDWEPPQRVIILRHARVAKTFRAMFQALWKRANPIDEGAGQ